MNRPAYLPSMTTSNRRVYLAGPDVFFKDAQQRAGLMKAHCIAHDLVGVFPLDAAIVFSPGESGPAKARRIFEANVALIRSCAGVLANMTPFRGPSADVGTAWEMGFAAGLGLPVVGYTESCQMYEDRVTPDEYEIEAFRLDDNLMLAWGVVDIWTNPERAVACLAQVLELWGRGADHGALTVR